MKQEAEFDWLNIDGAAALIRPGEGGAIVIIPGAMADAQGWLPFAAALNSRRSIAIINRRGRAPSGDLAQDATVANEVEDVRTLLSHIQGPFILLGWSYGGLLAMEVAKNLTELDSIILYEPVIRPFAADAVDPLLDYIEKDDLDGAVEYILTKIGGAPSDHVHALRATDDWENLKILSIPAAVELSAINSYQPEPTEYAAISAPVAVIIGSINENAEPYGTAANRFLFMLKDARQISLEGQGHLAHVEAPEQLAEAVNALLNE